MGRDSGQGCLLGQLNTSDYRLGITSSNAQYPEHTSLPPACRLPGHKSDAASGKPLKVKKYLISRGYEKLIGIWMSEMKEGKGMGNVSE